MAEADPWAGLIDPRAALAKRRAAARTLASSSQTPPASGESKNSNKTDIYESFSHSSHSSRGARAISPTSHSAAKDREITCSSSLSDTYADPPSLPGLSNADYESSSARAPAKVAKWLNQGSTYSNCSTIALATPAKALAITNTVPSPTAHLSGPKGWRDGLARLDRWSPPCEGFRAGEWEGVHRAVSHFMDHCAVEAAARGWTALDLFGVHYLAGAAAVDGCGALMLPGGGVVTSVSADALAFGHLVYRKRPLPQSVLVWDLVKVAA